MTQEIQEKVEAAPSDSEPKEVLSEAEVRFERWRKRLGLIAGPLAALIIFLLPSSLSPEAHRLAALLAGVVIFWITEPIPIPITALLGPVLAIVLGIGKADAVLSSFGNPILFLFIGSFLIARAMEGHRLDRRFSLWLLSFRWVGDRPTRILWTLGGITAFLSMWISNTASTAMMFPIALGILSSLKEFSDEKGALQPYAVGVMLMVAYAASIGGVGTPIGTPPNLIGIGMIAKQTGREISFFQWMLLALPLLLVMYIVLYFLLLFLHPAGPSMRAGRVSEFIQAQRKAIGPWTRGQKNTLFAFLLAVFLWTFPGFLALIFGPEGGRSSSSTAACPRERRRSSRRASSFLPTNWPKQEYTLSWREAAGIDWGTILLFGGGLALGDLMFKTGLSQAVGEGLLSFLEIDSLWGITGLAIALGIVVSELTSNTASANMIIPVIIALATASGVSPIPPALGATLGASYGFMLPISTPPNAIVYGSGLIPIGRMVRAGVLFDLLGFLIIWGGLRLLCPLLGLM
ncbi:MAG: SLC13 family permease [Candidatus Manganitrophus sp.]|nr:SLC13 family permease [Candidatus Manganitrophus sp.]